MGTLSFEQELNLLKTGTRHEKIKLLKPEFSLETLITFKKNAENVQVPQVILEWTTLCLQKSREDEQVSPLSSRAGLDFISGLKSWAIIHDRNTVLVDDFVELFPYCFSHRLFQKKKEPLSLLIQKSHEWLKHLKL